MNSSLRLPSRRPKLGDLIDNRMRTSEKLEVGNVYTRKELQDLFKNRDATIRTGVFRPRGHDSIWLFITEEMTKDRTQYRNRLHGDDLEIDGQTAGLKDKMLFEHEANDLEVILFYRKSKAEFPGAGFRYEGRFRYVRHEGTRPAHFYFRRVE